MVGEQTQLNRMEDMLTQLIQIVGNTNASLSALRNEFSDMKVDVAELKADVAGLKVEVAVVKREQTDLKSTVYRIEHRLTLIDVKQQKTGHRLDNVEVEIELLKKH